MIGTDLFQMLALGLLALNVILTLLMLATLSNIRRSLSAGPAGGAAPEGATARVEPAALPAQQQAATPVATAAAASPAATAATPAPASAQAEPQEQPFERDGRWWFRRGDELLVYEERTGQWVPAGGETPGGAPPVAGSAAAGREVETGFTSALTAAPEAGGETGSFWKCPSCGAVNGATATSCRMCFAARP